MKVKDIITLVSIALGIGAGFGTYLLLPEAHWGVYVAAGLIVLGASARAFRDEVVQDRLFEGLTKKS